MSNIEQFESIKKFRDFNTLKIIDKDNIAYSIQDKFKDFQEIYIIIQKAIKNGNKKLIFSDENNIYYFISENQLVTNSQILSSSSLGYFWTTSSSKSSYDKEREEIPKALDKISNKLKDYNIVFKIPTYSQLKKLFDTGYSIYKGRWYYETGSLTHYGTTDNLYNFYGEPNF